MSFASFERECQRCRPRVAIVLGSGLGALAEDLRRLAALPFAQVPDLTAPSVPGHGGDLVLAAWGDAPTLIFSGRLHLYEGHPQRRVVQPANLARLLGCTIFLATNAAGGIRDDLVPGCLMTVDRHCTLLDPTAWKGCALDPGFRDDVYSRRLQEILSRVADEAGVRQARGSYVQVSGPCYETPAEIRALRSMGADAAGMSTAVEIEHAHSLGLECAALSCITNRGAGLGTGPIHHAEVLAAANEARAGLKKVIEGFVTAAQTMSR